MRKTLVTLAAGLGLLVAATGASAAVLVDQDTIYGGQSGNTIQLTATRTTTAYAFGVWNSHLTPIPVTYSANIDCAHNANDRFVPPTTVPAGRTLSPAAFLWFGSRAIAGPWFGWDTCSISVLISAPLDNDDSMIAWLVSHE